MIENLMGFPMPKNDKNKNFFDIRSETHKYYNIIMELYTTTFKWNNLPEEITSEGGEQNIERWLASQGKCLFFYDDILNEHLVSLFTGYGKNFYGHPTHFRVTASNGYSREFARNEAVAIYNSPMYTSELNTIRNFAEKLALCDLTIMLNVNTQKLPYIIRASEGQRLTMLNFMKKLDEFEPKLFIDTEFDETALKILPINAPFIGNNLYDLKAKYWEETLRFLGIGTGTQKKERVGAGEQEDNQGHSKALLNTRLSTRELAAEQINKMFGLDVKVEVRADLQEKEVEVPTTKGEGVEE